MSYLRLYAPQDTDSSADSGDNQPEIIPFRRFFFSRFNQHRTMDSVTRARVLHQNRRCPYCTHPVVEPVELNDQIMNRSQLPIPGSGTLVGFHCCNCHAEWPVEQSS